MTEGLRRTRTLRRWSTPAAAAFAAAFAGMLMVALLQGAKVFYYDANEYWTLAGSFTRHGHFSLLNFDSPLRGYVLPLINHGLQVIGDGLEWSKSTMAKLFNVLMFALIGAVLAPRFAEIAWPQQRWGLLRRLALTALLVIFWSGWLNFPLSDFPALTFALLALVAIARPDSPGWMLVAGLACGVALDMRPAYLLLGPIMLALVAWSWVEQRGDQHASKAHRVLCIGLLAVGFVAVSLPQSLSSHRHHHTWSIVPGSASNLSNVQLTDGLLHQRFETYIGPGRPAPEMFYIDEAGERLLREQKGDMIDGVGQYLGLIVSHPITMGGLFARHVVNGVDQRYTTPYIEHLDNGSHRWLRLAGFLLVFLALVRLLWPTARRRLGRAKWRYPLALALCCLTSIPSQMETRYLLPAYLLIYILVLAPGWPNPLGPSEAGFRRFRTPVILVVSYLAFMAVAWSVVSDTSRHLHFG